MTLINISILASISRPLYGQRGHCTTSRRSRSSFEVIFETHDPNKIGIDIHYDLNKYFNFGLHFEAIIRPQGGQ